MIFTSEFLPLFLTNLFCGLSFVAALIISYKYHQKEFFNPIVIFFFIWLSGLLLYTLGIFTGYFYEILHPYAAILLAESFLFFLFGYITYLFLWRRKTKCQPAISKPIQIYDIELRWLGNVTLFLFFIFFFSVLLKYFYLYLHYGSAMTKFFYIREDLLTGKFSFPVYLKFSALVINIFILNLGILLGIFGLKNKKWLLLVVLAFILIFFNDLSTGDRGGIRHFALLITTITIISIANGFRMRAKHYCYGFLSLVLIMLLLSSVVYFRAGHYHVDFINGILLSSLYGNIIGNIPSFSYFIDHPWQTGLNSGLPGYYTFIGTYAYLDVIYQALFHTSLLPMTMTSSAVPETYAEISGVFIVYNSTNHLTMIFMDFGELGVVIYSYLLGLVAAILCFMAYNKKRIIYIQLFALFMIALMVTIRGAYFGAIGFWVTIFLIILQGKLISLYTSKNKTNSTT